MTGKKCNYEESRGIALHVARALDFVQSLESDPGPAAFKRDVAGIKDALECIAANNEARDKARRINIAAAMPDLSESVCRGLLEIGCDVGIQEAAKVFGGSRLEIERVFNPFRRSTTIEDYQCSKCKHSLAADGRCHSIGCECDCNNSDTARMPEDKFQGPEHDDTKDGNQ